MSSNHSELLYDLNDSPAFLPSLTAAIQHLLASFVGVITPTLIVTSTLGLTEYTPYLISMALFVSGLGTAIQTKRIGPVGSGLVAIQGTSFAFISALILAGNQGQGGWRNTRRCLVFVVWINYGGCHGRSGVQSICT